VDQGERVDHLDRARGIEGFHGASPNGLGAGHAEGGAKALPRSQAGVAHGGVQLGGRNVGGG
jgi:hypothetical protein